MIRRYTLLGASVAFITAGVFAFGFAAAPDGPLWLVALVGIALGSIAGWAAARRDSLDLRRVQQLVDSLNEGDLWRRTRLQRPDQIGDLGRGLDSLSEGLASSEMKERGRKDRLRTILDAMTEAVIVTDSRGRITLTNEVLTDLVGFDTEGKTAVEAIRHPDFHRAIEDAQRGYASVLEIEIEGVDAVSRRVLRASVSPLRKQRGTVAVFHDVTAERDAERVRRDFVANAGHELRTPLTAIRGFTETLRDGGVQDLDSMKGFLDVILRHTHRLQALVDDLADLSRFEGEELELDLQPVEVGALLDQVIRGLESQSRTKRQTVTAEGLDEAPPVLAEERALEQVLVNLLDNAIKYAPEAGEIRVRIGRETEKVAIEVSNSGPGISARHLPRIFERFYRVDAGRSRELGGTGLGLSIVKHLVAKLGGEISVESAGGWTRFQLLLSPVDSRKSDTAVSRD